MFKTKIETTAFQTTVKAMAAVIDEACFTFSPDGMDARAVDPSNAMLCAISIPSDVFIEYDVSEAEIGIDLNRFVEIISMADKNDSVEMVLNLDTHKLDINMGEMSYTLALLDPSTLRKSPSVPELDLPAEIVLSTSKFKQAIKASGMVADAMKIGIDGKTVYMEACGDSDNVLLELSGDDLVSLKEATVSGTYSLDYLSDISKGVGATPEITINLGRDLPMVLDFTPYPRCDVTYLLAPRINPEG